MLREDLEAAETLFAQQSVVPRHLCWLAQQATEKALKAVLVFVGIDFPRRHDLDALRNLIPTGWQVKEEHPDLASLTEWAVEARYPGDWPEATETDAQAAVPQARAVWEAITTDFANRGFEHVAMGQTNIAAATTELVKGILTLYPQAQIVPRVAPLEDEDISMEVRLPMQMEEIYQVRDQVHELVIQLQEQYDVLILASAIPV